MLRVGSPEQVVRILPSTAGQAVWVVSTQGCVQNEAGKPASINCADSRGELFDPSMSTSWNDAGNYTMELEMNLGFGDTANFGLETIALGASDAIGGPQLTNQTVAAFANDDFYIGLFGLNQQPTNVTSMNNPQPSFLETLRARNFIPSLSWGYTAGARYRE